MNRRRATRHAAVSLAAVCVVASSGCVRFGYFAHQHEQPVTEQQLQALVPGTSDLTTCLHRLGAPHFVWEYRGNGMALAYAHLDDAGWSFDASYAVSDYASASLELDFDHGDFPGAVLWFDADLHLERWQLGSLREMTRSLRVRPADLDAAATPR